MLAMFALAMVHRAVLRKDAMFSADTCLAALAVAAVPATNWPATLALLMSLGCYALALSKKDLGDIARLVVIGVGAIGFAAPFAPPSTVLSTFAQANVMGDGPTPGSGRWISFALMILALIALRALLAWRQTPFALRFPLLWFLLTGWIVMTATLTGIRMIPQPVRFHLAMEIPFALAIASCALWIARRWRVLNRPAIKLPAIALLTVLCSLQAYNYRRYARTLIRPLEIENAAEYQMAQWCEANMGGQRIFTAGTFGFWLNDFTSTPQMSGFFDQSISNFENRVASYIVPAGYHSDRESADYSLLWLKAWAAAAIQIGGPKTADVYHDFLFPDRFRSLLAIVWSHGDDYVYRVPERTEGLARVVRRRDLIRNAPANGIDVAELRPFVAALEDPALPPAHFEWRGTNNAAVTGSFAPDQVISVAVNFDPGWTATMNGRPVRLYPDGMGMIVLEPNCSGNCAVQMHWSPGREPAALIITFLLTVAGCATWCILTRRREPPGTNRPAESFA